MNARFLLLLLLLTPSMLFAQTAWEPLPGPYGGSVTSFYHHHRLGLLAGTEGGGVFRSVDSGKTWQRFGDVTETPVVWCFMEWGARLYMGTDHGVFVTEDDGATWKATGREGLQYNDIRGLSVHRGQLYAATWFDGIAKSTDSGRTWKKVVHKIIQEPWFLSILSVDSTLLVGSDRRLYRTTNEGGTWDTLFSYGGDISSILMKDSMIYCAATDGMMRSADTGKTWKYLGGADVVGVAIAEDGTLYRASIYQNGLSRSTDNGVTWKPCTTGLSIRTFKAITTVGNSVILNPYEQGIWRSTNQGEEWARVEQDIAATHVSQVTANQFGLFAATNYNGVARSTDAGLTWKTLFPGRQVTTVATTGDTVYIGTANNPYLYRSTDNGTRWEELERYTGTGVYSVTEVFANQGEVFVSVERGIGRSTDGGKTWTYISTGLPDAYVSCFATNQKALFVGTYSSWKNRDAGIFRSTDHGQSWDTLKTKLGSTTDVHVLTVFGDTIFAGTDGGVYRSTDNGDTWEQLKTAGGGTIKGLVRVGSAYYIAAPYSGIRRSTDNGNTWETINKGLPPAVGPLISPGRVESLCYQNGYLFVGLINGSTARLKVQEPTVGLDASPHQASVLSILPNPISHRSATLLAPLPDGTIHVQMIDPLGKIVWEEPNLPLNNGIAQLRLQAIPAGCYRIVASQAAQQPLSTLVIVQ